MQDSWERFYVNPAELTKLYQELLTAQRAAAQAATTSRDPQFIAVARAIKLIQDEYAAELNMAASKTAIAADKAIVIALKAKMVRPPTGMRPGLADVIWSTPVQAGPFSFGEVEIAWLSKLEQAVGTSGEPYWRTQEYGYAGNIGRQIFGTFMGAGGSSLPSQLEFRQHPIFMPGQGGPGTIDRPIPGKHFLKEGTAVAADLWLSLVRAATQRVVVKLRSISIP
jgi:hypothetical protein